VAAISKGLAQGLEPSLVRDVRVKGAIGVVELDRIDDLGVLRQRFVEAGVFIRVYLTPAFTIGEEDQNRFTGAVLSVLLDPTLALAQD
jgi:adenosylmethionine---8-amino-7-oxononanoate aminotransferase